MSKKKLDEEITTGGVDGLGVNSGTPAGVVDYVSKYVNGNAMSYVDENGNKLAWMKKHRKGHDHNPVGFDEFDPTDLTKKHHKRQKIDEVRLPKVSKRAKKAIATGMTVANLYTAGDVASRAAQGEGNPVRDVVAAASTLPKALGYAATAAHYGRKAYERMTQQNEDCWKGYEAIGVKKKGKRTVPNCVPVKEEESLEEGNKVNRQKKKAVLNVIKRKKKADGSATPFDPRRMLSPHNRKKAHDASSQVAEERLDEVGNTEGGRKKLMDYQRQAMKDVSDKSKSDHKRANRAMGLHAAADRYVKGKRKAEKQIDELTANTPEALGKYLKDASKSRKKALEDNGAKPDIKTWSKRQQGISRAIKKLTSEAAVDLPNVQHMHGPQFERPGMTRQAPARQFSRSVSNVRTNMGAPQGAMRGGVSIERAAPARPASFSQGQGGTMKVSSTNVGARAPAPKAPTFSQGAGGTMSGSVKTSSGGLGRSAEYSRSLVGSMSDKLDTVSRGMSKSGAATAVSKAAPAVASGIAKGLGTAARVLGGPAATAAAAVMDPTPAGEKKSEFERQDSLKNGNNPYKASGRSITDYENDTINKKKPEATAPAANPKADVPTPPSRPDFMTRGDAFKAARGEAGGGSGKFSYQGGNDSAPKEYQTNRADKAEPYKPASQLKQTSIKEGTMDTLETINEALDNIIEDNLIDMRENFIAVLQEKAMERLEERKREIASQYFAQ